MPLFRVNATTSGLRLHGASLQNRCRFWESSTPSGPAIIMLHGYKYAPATPDHCPHQKILGTAPSAWPAKLGFAAEEHADGLAIALGWYARGRLSDAHRRATTLGRQLARIVALLRDQAPDRPVHILAHSLGVELALNALAHLPAGSVDRMVLLTGASYNSLAHEMLTTEAGSSAEVLNVVSRENDLFDAVFEKLVPARGPVDRAIGHGIDASNVVNLQIDCARSIAALKQLSFDISPASKRVCHWSSYRRQGLMALYSEFLRAPEALSLTKLSGLLPQSRAPRWSRLMPDLLRKGPSVSRGLHNRLYELASPGRRIAAAVAGRTESEHAN